MASKSIEAPIFGIKNEQPRVLAFDLSLEHQRIHEPILEGQDVSIIFKLRRKRFFENAWSYAREISGVALAKYPPYRIERENGTITLHADGYNNPVRELYNPDSQDPNLPWPEYRLTGINYIRAKREHEAFSVFEANLANAQEGDVFVWISLPPVEILFSDMDMATKKKALRDLGYGFHTNTFVLTVENSYLRGRVIQNYLDPAGHRELVKRLTGKDLFNHDPDDLELLGKIVKVENDAFLSAMDIKKIIDKIYANTPGERKLNPPNDELARRFLEEQQIEAILKQTHPLLEQVFCLLYHLDKEDLQDKDIRRLIEERFHGWENAVQALRKGEEVNFSALEGLTSKELKQLAINEIAEIKRRKVMLVERQAGWMYGQQIFPEIEGRLMGASMVLDQLATMQYQPVATNCGAGSGFYDTPYLDLTPLASFSPERIWERLTENPLNLAITYQSAENLRREVEKGKFRCPNCGKEADPCGSECHYCHTKNPNLG